MTETHKRDVFVLQVLIVFKGLRKCVKILCDVIIFSLLPPPPKKLLGLSPQANYTDRATVACRRVPTFTDRECHVVSVTDPYDRILCFLDRSRYYFFQAAPQLYSRGLVDPVPDVLRKWGSAGNGTNHHLRPSLPSCPMELVIKPTFKCGIFHDLMATFVILGCSNSSRWF
jgi:hypothetical protein